MNSGKEEKDKQHKRATRIASEERCLACSKDPPSEPCHIIHRGMGGGKAGWDTSEWCPLCRKCHDRFDARNGASAHAQEDTRITRYIVATRFRDWQHYCEHMEDE